MRQTQNLLGFVHSQAYVKAIACLVLACGGTMTAVAASDNSVAPQSQAVQQDGVTVKGVVVDEQGEPIIGASVIEQGNKSNGTVTDLDGKYVLRLKNGKSSVEVSYIGFKTVTVSTRGGARLYYRQITNSWMSWL